jgi:XTP/dITP diphosphohydrolase
MEGTPMRLILATFNQGKRREYRHLLSSLPVQLMTLAEAGVTAEVPEDGATFQENALLKGRGYAAAAGCWTLADDSGLEVDALGGAPGVHSSRYAGLDATDADNVRLLLKNMEHIPIEKRQARFRCVIALAAPDGRSWTCNGVCEGEIAMEPRGEHGFGYDPVFWLPDMGKTMAELPPELKDQISHRAAAARSLLQLWPSIVRG